MQRAVIAGVGVSATMLILAKAAELVDAVTGLEEGSVQVVALRQLDFLLVTFEEVGSFKVVGAASAVRLNFVTVISLEMLTTL